MTFSIVTPSFRNSKWLKLCVASVADQQGVEFEHIVQDACSDDGTQDWLPQDRRVRAFIEKDNGMYDAINRGYQRAKGDLLAHLNSDEQYLPGTLNAVHEFFERHPKVEALVGGAIVVDSDGNYVCHWPAMLSHPCHIWYRFPSLTCSIFIRRRVIHERGHLFDTRWRAAADMHWVLSLMKDKVPMVSFDHYTSAFADTGENLSLMPTGVREARETLAMAPRWVRLLKPLWIGHHRLRRLAASRRSLKPCSYSIYTIQSPAQRVQTAVPKPSAIWRGGFSKRRPSNRHQS